MSNDIKMDMEVLCLYAENEQEGVATTLKDVMALPYAQKSLRLSVQDLKATGYLEGTRLLKLTDSGWTAQGGKRTSIPTVSIPTAEEKVATLSETLASRFLVTPEQLYKVIARNVITVGRNEAPPTPEEIFLTMTVANQYNLNPFVRELHCFRHRGKLQVMVGADGWIAIAQRHPNFKGVEYEYPDPEKMVNFKGKKAFPWIKATCHIEGRVPTVIYAFLDEWGHASDNWADHPNHRLRLKAYTMAVREALGISLLDDTDKAIMELNTKNEASKGATATSSMLEQMKEKMTEGTPPEAETEEPTDAEYSELQEGAANE